MLVRDILNRPQVSFSFEFFPPKTDEGWTRLFETITELQPLAPSSVSVTYGAGGSTRERTHDLVVRIRRETGITVVSHLTCVGSTRAEIRDILARYDAAGVCNILALRGDPPKNATGPIASLCNDFPHAADLVAFVKQEFPSMGVGVAGFPEGHPDTPNRLKEMDHLKAKVDAGADYIVTQLFFENRDFYDFRERCELAGIRVPIVAGIMPVTTRQSMVRMADLAAGSRIPAGLLRAIGSAPDDAEVERIGIAWATEQVCDLVAHGARGIHFYTLNQSKATLRICEAPAIRAALRPAGL